MWFACPSHLINMSLEEQAEFLTTQWMSVKQLEEAGKHGAAELQNSQK